MVAEGLEEQEYIQVLSSRASGIIVQMESLVQGDSLVLWAVHEAAEEGMSVDIPHTS